MCKDGTPAIFTHDNFHSSEADIHMCGPQVGGMERYEALCRKHFLQNKHNLMDPFLPTLSDVEREV
jgi:thymidine kinase